MKHFIATLADVMQKEMDHPDAGRELAMAMAKDDMSYHDAHCKIHHMMKVLEHAERCLSKAAFKELSMAGKRMNPALMGENSHY